MIHKSKGNLRRRFLLIHDVSSAPNMLVKDVVWFSSSMEGMAGEV